MLVPIPPLPPPSGPATLAKASHQLRAMQQENAVLINALAKAQQRTSVCISALHGQVQDQSSLLVRLRGALLLKETELMCVRDDMAALLHASGQAADLVICQTGCVSHNQHWLDGTDCKRTGQPCVLRAE